MTQSQMVAKSDGEILFESAYSFVENGSKDNSGPLITFSNAILILFRRHKKESLIHLISGDVDCSNA